MHNKENIYRAFLQLIREKVLNLQTILGDLRESASNETKSTAGDKHETALAMLQIEQENTRRQLADAMEQLGVMEKLDYGHGGERVGKGSLVGTDRGMFLLAAAVGKIKVPGNRINEGSKIAEETKFGTSSKIEEEAKFKEGSYVAVQTIISISPQSPLGKALTGKRVGDKVEVNKLEYRIISVE
ncbi:GreA/GreB family elongation factor [Flavihumibacter sp. ZG627]|uniref:GreA/GreB family elongation factor n=1 Tax=Flavihumibacter sp. ZG627 TaxID=1463156 RepID=UPI00057E7E66|nr:GreA/GreB family elongation factor [Flavihumibacter sp. ZG627]